MTPGKVSAYQDSNPGPLLREGMDRLGIPVADDHIDQLVYYIQELQKWSKKVNLVARNTSLPDIVEKHFIDSLTLLPVLRDYNLEGGPLLDVGSGAGFPGLVLKIACPSLETVLLEPRQRRASFLNHVARTIAVRKFRVVVNRIEENSILSTYSFSVITGRAVADIATFLKLVSSRSGNRTLVVCMQGEAGRQEWERRHHDSEFVRVGTKQYTLPFSGARRHLLLFRKTN